MIGDGVNDVLPLRGADLAVAMASGSAATRAAADLVLLGDAFAVLPRAVVEGRRIVAAMQATLILLLSRTFAVLFIVAAAALLALPFPITPRQNAVLALLTVGAPLILLVLWVPPSRTPPHLLRHTLGTSIPAAAALALLCLGAFGWALSAGATDQVARTILTSMAVFGGLGLLPLIRRRGDHRRTATRPGQAVGACARVHRGVHRPGPAAALPGLLRPCASHGHRTRTPRRGRRGLDAGPPRPPMDPGRRRLEHQGRDRVRRSRVRPRSRRERGPRRAAG